MLGTRPRRKSMIFAEPRFPAKKGCFQAKNLVGVLSFPFPSILLANGRRFPFFGCAQPQAFSAQRVERTVERESSSQGIFGAKRGHFQSTAITVESEVLRVDKKGAFSWRKAIFLTAKMSRFSVRSFLLTSFFLAAKRGSPFFWLRPAAGIRSVQCRE